MWLDVPDKPANVLFEGALEPAQDALERVTRDSPRELAEDELNRAIRNLPIVSIGQPEVWPIQDLYPAKKMPAELKTKLSEADYYLARFACSFRARTNEVQLDWARFWVRLQPDDDGNQPIAFDLHPREVTHEIQRNVKVSLSPSLSFKEVEASMGGVEFGISYNEIQPIVSAAGAGEANVDWSYETPKGTHLHGSKWMHLLIRAPHNMESGSASLDLVADVTLRGTRLLPAFLSRSQEEVEASLRATLWG